MLRDEGAAKAVVTGEKTLYVAWQDKSTSRLWFPVGRLDVDFRGTEFRFRYTVGAKLAKKERYFVEFHEFPDLQTAYISDTLFAFFRNRVIAPNRSNRLDYLGHLGLTAAADPFEVLSVNGGTRVTDSFEVFPMLKKGEDGAFSCRFFLHGWRYVTESARLRTDRLMQGEELTLSLDEENPVDKPAIAICTSENGKNDAVRIGWTPRYLVRDLAAVMREDPKTLSARVVRLNPLPAPSTQHLLIELSGNWGSHTPMSDPDLQPLVP